MRFPRMTTRRWMVVAAAIAILLAGVARSSRLRAIAAHHAWFEECYRKDAEAALATANDESPIGRQGPIGKAYRRNLAAQFARKSDYHAASKLKYERAALYPWLPVEPDSPTPE